MIWFEYTSDERQKLSPLEGYRFETLELINVYVIPDNELGEIKSEFELGPDATEATGVCRRNIGFKALRGNNAQS